MGSRRRGSCARRGAGGPGGALRLQLGLAAEQATASAAGQESCHGGGSRPGAQQRRRAAGGAASGRGRVVVGIRSAGRRRPGSARGGCRRSWCEQRALDRSAPRAASWTAGPEAVRVELAVLDGAAAGQGGEDCRRGHVGERGGTGVGAVARGMPGRVVGQQVGQARGAARVAAGARAGRCRCLHSEWGPRRRSPPAGPRCRPPGGGRPRREHRAQHERGQLAEALAIAQLAQRQVEDPRPSAGPGS